MYERCKWLSLSMDHLIIGSPDSLKTGIRSETCVCVCVCVLWYHACSCDVGVCCHLGSQQVWCSPQLILYRWMLHFLTNLHQMETI